MKQLLTIVSLVTILCAGIEAEAHNEETAAGKRNLRFTIEEIIDLSKNQSPEGIQAKHAFRASYWEFRSYKAGFMPSLVFDATLPDFSRSYKSQWVNESYRYVQDFSSRISGSLNVEQNVPLTGGRISVGSSLSRTDVFGADGSVQYMSSPISISYSQSIFGVNQFKWDKKIEPLKYEEAKRKYLRAMENVSTVAIRYFFDLAAAQQNVAIAEFNKANTDTLYHIAQGRYNIGTIGENDMLQSELNYMNASATLNDALLNLATSKNRLRSFLGFNESVDISIIIPEHVPELQFNLDRIMSLAKENNPDPMAYRRQIIEAQRNVAVAKANRGFTADIYARFGLDQRAVNVNDVYKNPNDMETVQIGLRIPILDWGRGKGRVKMAQSNEELVRMQVEQAMSDFEQNVVLQVNQFNMQGDQYRITAKADTIAQNRYKVSMQRFLIDKIDITEMNNAQNDRDAAKQRYIMALRNYWAYYYNLRLLTLYDLAGNKPLAADYDTLVDK